MKYDSPRFRSTVRHITVLSWFIIVVNVPQSHLERNRLRTSLLHVGAGHLELLRDPLRQLGRHLEPLLAAPGALGLALVASPARHVPHQPLHDRREQRAVAGHALEQVPQGVEVQVARVEQGGEEGVLLDARISRSAA